MQEDLLLSPCEFEKLDIFDFDLFDFDKPS